jgi:Phage tail assembly chaperone protein
MDIEPNIEDVKKYNKNIRNELLLETDKYVLPDFPITPDNLIIIKDYRQKLRDFTKNNYELPARPEFI